MSKSNNKFLLTENFMGYNSTELETIGLCICVEGINDILNHELAELSESKTIPIESTVYFHTSVHQQLFLIRLLDFVKERGSKKLTGVEGSCLEVLKTACDTKSFNVNGSIENLKNAIDELDKWLNVKKKITIWLPTLNLEATLEITRLDFLHISGNQSKHNISRLTVISEKIWVILNDHGYKVPLEFIPLALDEFKENIGENYFVYYGTWLCELMNNIRWGIQDYLEPTFKNCHEKIDPKSFNYKYRYPPQLQQEIPKEWFWRLMNNIRAEPYLKKFVGSASLKNESSLEWAKGN